MSRGRCFRAGGIIAILYFFHVLDVHQHVLEFDIFYFFVLQVADHLTY